MTEKDAKQRLTVALRDLFTAHRKAGHSTPIACARVVGYVVYTWSTTIVHPTKEATAKPFSIEMERQNREFLDSISEP